MAGMASWAGWIAGPRSVFQLQTRLNALQPLEGQARMRKTRRSWCDGQAKTLACELGHTRGGRVAHRVDVIWICGCARAPGARGDTLPLQTDAFILILIVHRRKTGAGEQANHATLTLSTDAFSARDFGRVRFSGRNTSSICASVRRPSWRTSSPTPRPLCSACSAILVAFS